MTSQGSLSRSMTLQSSSLSAVDGCRVAPALKSRLAGLHEGMGKPLLPWSVIMSRPCNVSTWFVTGGQRRK